MRKEMKVRGIVMVYDDLGDGPVILLIHGQPFNRTMWRYQTDMLEKDYRLIIPDLRGYGETDISTGMVLLDELALDLIQLLQLLGIAKAIVVGLSMGGQIAFEMYRYAPQLFRGLILADTEARAEDEAGYQRRLELSSRILKDGMEKFTNERIRHFMCAETFRSKPHIVAHLEKMMRTTSPEGSAAVQRGRAERLDYTPLLPTIDFPALIVVGDQDEFTPLASAAYMHQRVAGSELVVVKDCGHISNMEQPEQFNSAVASFLRTFAC
jgi:pimeloyl-ACP methyl ester carboxylesterase